MMVESADTDPEDDMDIDGLGGSMMIESSKGKKKSYEVEYSDLGPEELERRMKADTVKVADICQLSVRSFHMLL